MRLLGKKVSVPEGDIYIYEKALPKYICEDIISQMDKILVSSPMNYNRGDFIENNKLKLYMKTLINDSIKIPFENVDFCNRLTLMKSNKAIVPHRDKVYEGENYKVLIYLNDVKNGGTYFKNEKDWFYTENSAGTIVIFDMNIEHKGDPLQEKIRKYTFGLRLNVKS